jgi:predicted RNA-binding protein with PUA-like domain
VNWLFKEEPTHYGYEMLEKDGRTTWSGVKNALAQKHLRAVRKDDPIFYYHTGNEKAIVAIARAATDAYRDPEDPAGKSWVVDVVPARRLARPVPLSEIKADGQFADFPLVHLPRLSVMPVDDTQWRKIESMSGS